MVNYLLIGFNYFFEGICLNFIKEEDICLRLMLKREEL